MWVVLDAEVTAGGGGFADDEIYPHASNARAAGNLDGGSGARAPVGPGRDPFLMLFYDRYIRWLAAPFWSEWLAPLRAPPDSAGRGPRPWNQSFCTPSNPHSLLR